MFKKADNHSTFIPRNNLLFYFNKLEKKIKQTKKIEKEEEEEKVRQNIFFFIFQNWPKKGAKGDAVYIVNACESVFEEDEAKEAAEKKNKKTKKSKKS